MKLFEILNLIVPDMLFLYTVLSALFFSRFVLFSTMVEKKTVPDIHYNDECRVGENRKGERL